MHQKKLRRFHRRIGTCRKNKTRKKHVFAQYLVFFWRKSLNLDWVKKFEKNRNLELQKQKKQQKISFFFFVVYAVEIFVFLQLKKNEKKKKKKTTFFHAGDIKKCKPWTFYPKTCMSQSLHEKKPLMKDEVNLPKAARTSAVHSSPFT